MYVIWLGELGRCGSPPDFSVGRRYKLRGRFTRLNGGSKFKRWAVYAGIWVTKVQQAATTNARIPAAQAIRARQDSSTFESFASNPPRCIFSPNHRRNQYLLLTRFLLTSERPFLADSGRAGGASALYHPRRRLGEAEKMPIVSDLECTREPISVSSCRRSRCPTQFAPVSSSDRNTQLGTTRYGDLGQPSVVW